jgi:hypothetical protein
VTSAASKVCNFIRGLSSQIVVIPLPKTLRFPAGGLFLSFRHAQA